MTCTNVLLPSTLSGFCSPMISLVSYSNLTASSVGPLKTSHGYRIVVSPTNAPWLGGGYQSTTNANMSKQWYTPTWNTMLGNLLTPMVVAADGAVQSLDGSYVMNLTWARRASDPNSLQLQTVYFTSTSNGYAMTMNYNFTVTGQTGSLTFGLALLAYPGAARNPNYFMEQYADQIVGVADNPYTETVSVIASNEDGTTNMPVGPMSAAELSRGIAPRLSCMQLAWISLPDDWETDSTVLGALVFTYPMTGNLGGIPTTYLPLSPSGVSGPDNTQNSILQPVSYINRIDECYASVTSDASNPFDLKGAWWTGFVPNSHGATCNWQTAGFAPYTGYYPDNGASSFVWNALTYRETGGYSPGIVAQNTWCHTNSSASILQIQSQKMSAIAPPGWVEDSGMIYPPPPYYGDGTAPNFLGMVFSPVFSNAYLSGWPFTMSDSVIITGASPTQVSSMWLPVTTVTSCNPIVPPPMWTASTSTVTSTADSWILGSDLENMVGLTWQDVNMGSMWAFEFALEDLGKPAAQGPQGPQAPKAPKAPKSSGSDSSDDESDGGSDGGSDDEAPPSSNLWMIIGAAVLLVVALVVLYKVWKS